MSAVQQMLAAAAIRNYATWNPSDKHASVTLSGGNLTSASGFTTSVRSTIGKASGKWYWEVLQNTTDNCSVGVATSSSALTSIAGGTATSWGYLETGLIRNNSSTLFSGTAYSSGVVIGVALDIDLLTVQFFRNNVSQGSYSIAAGTYFAMVGSFASTTANFGASAFTYSPPSGFNSGLFQ